MKLLKPVVLQQLDSPRRDFEWRLYFAYLLSKKNIASAIGPAAIIHTIHENSRDSIIFGRFGSHTGRSESDKKFVKKMGENSTRVFFLHDEGGFYSKESYDESVIRVYPVEYFALPQFITIYCWGEAQKKSLIKAKANMEKVSVTGAPRFDLCRDDHASIDIDKTNKLKANHGDYILITSRFASANKGTSDPHPLGNRLKHIYLEAGSKNSDSKFVLEKMFSGWSKINHEFSDFVPMIAKLLTEYPEEKFVIRPHPAESQSFYDEAFCHFDNVIVSKEGDVRPWIRASKLVIHSECTTGLEADIMGVPTINFRPQKNLEERFGVSGLIDVGCVAENYAQLSKIVARVLKGEKIESHSNNLIHYIANLPPSAEAAILIVDDIASYVENHDLVTSVNINRMILLAHAIKNNVNRAYQKMRYKQYKHVDSKQYNYNINEIRDLWAAFGGDKDNLKIINDLVLTGLTN